MDNKKTKTSYRLGTILIMLMVVMLSMVQIKEVETQLGVAAYKPLKEITAGSNVEQTFIAEGKKLKDITLFMANYNRENDSNLLIEVIGDNKVLKEIIIDAKEVPNNDFFTLNLGDLKIKKGTLLTLRLTSDASIGEGVTVWYDSQSIQGHDAIQLTQGNERVLGSLVMKVTTKHSMIVGTWFDAVSRMVILGLMIYIIRGKNPYLKVLGLSTLMTVALIAISEKSVQVEPIILWLNICVMYLILLLLLLVDKKRKIGLYVGWTLFVVIAISSFIKLTLKREPFLPWDIFSIKEGLAISKENNLGMYISGELVVLVLVPYFFIYKLQVQEQLKKVTKPLCITVFFAIVVVTQLLWNEERMSKFFNVSNLVWNQSNNLMINKLPLITVMNSEYLKIEKPENYSRNSIESLIKQRGSEESTNSLNSPNVILVMNESWVDLRNVKNLETFNQVMAPLDVYKQKSLYGSTLSPVIGGGTANAEYEVLTGQSTRFLPLGSIAYPMFINEDTFAITKFFKQRGYYNVAVHPYLRTFWNRENVYDKFLFDAYYSDEIIEDPIYKNGYIADSEVVQKIIEINEKKGQEPLFCFAVTMQNHQPYNNPDQYDTLVDIPTGIFDPAVEETLEVYLTGVQDANQMFIELATYIDTLQEPTILIMFGDHYPPLGEQVYEALIGKRWGELTQEELMKFYTTPFIAYRNYDPTPKDLGLMSMFYLLPTVFAESDIARPYYFEFLLRQFEMSKGYTSQFALDHKGALIGEPHASMTDHSMLHYNNLKGKNYFYKEIFE